jgi:uncharacterized protein (TIGR02099 family)
LILARTRNVLHWIWRQLLTWSLVALLLLAAWVGLGRELMPLVANYKERLEARLTARIGVPVHIRALRGEWDGLAPYFVADDIELRDPRQPDRVLLRLPGLTTRPALLPSLLNREPRLVTTLNGLSLHLQQKPDGQMEIAELALLASSDPAAARQTMSLLLRQPYIALEDGHIVLGLNRRPPLVMSGLQLSSFNEGRQHWFKGSFHVPDSQQPVNIVMRFQGDPQDWAHTDLQAWLSTPALDLGPWLKDMAVPELAIGSARAGGEYWVDVHQGSLQAITGQLALPEATLLLRSGKRSSSYVAKNLHGLLRLQREAQGWTFSANNLSGHINGLPLPAPRFALQVEDRQLTLSVAQLALEPLRQLAQNAAELPPEAQSWLQATALGGWVPHLRLTVARGADGELGTPQVQAEFKALTLASHKGLPGIDNFAGWLSVGADGGEVYLDSRHTLLDLHQFFRAPLPADSLSGGLRLRRGDSAWELQSGPLQVSNSDASGNAVLSVSIPFKDPGAAQMHLLAGLHEAKANSAWRYTPWTSAGDDTLAWMKAAFTGGTVSNGYFLFDGPLNTRRDLPESQLQMRFQLRDASLAYTPGWPPIENMQAEVLISNSRLSISSPVSQVYGTHADNVTALIPDLSHPVLSVSASLHGPADDVMQLFRNSPLKAQLGNLGQSMNLDGDIIGQLDLLVPLDARPTRVRIEADLPGNRLKLIQPQLLVEQLQGHVSYSSEQGLSSKHLEGHLLGGDIVARINSQVHGGELSQVHVVVDGRTGVPALQQWSGSSLLHYLDGDSDYQADISIPTDSRPSQLLLSSSMEGLRINLPAPFGKGLEAMPLRYQSDLGQGKTSARLQLGRHINVGMIAQDGHVKGVLLRVGQEGGVAFPEQPGLAIEANMPRVNVEDWQRWWSSNGAAGAGDLALSSATVDTQQLIVGGYVLRNAQINASHDDGVWTLSLGSDRLSGQITLPPAGKTQAGVGVALNKLEWPLPLAPGSKGSAGLPHELSDVPVALHISALSLDSWPNLGESEVSAHVLSSDYGVGLSQVQVSNSGSNSSFQGAINWQWQGHAQTRIDGLVQGSDISVLVKNLGFNPTLTTGRSRTELHLNWEGGPEDVSIASLNGKFESQACKGRLLNVGLVTSASRIFGLFDPDNIKRRLHLDFNDVIKKGVGYDEAIASAEIHNGVLVPGRFAFAGPSMSAEGHGRVDLNNSTVEQDINVTLPVVAGALPGAIAFVANPLLGAVVVGFDTLWNKEIGKLTTLHYHVSGNWADPQVTRGAALTDKPKADKDKSRPKEKDRELAPLCSEKT